MNTAPDPAEGSTIFHRCGMSAKLDTRWSAAIYNSTFSGNTLTGLDPVLADNGGPTQTHALLAGSNAIDHAGDCGELQDQRGFPREQNLCDSGAYEFADEDSVDLTGTVETAAGDGLCAMVLASGQFMFSCNPNGPFSLLDLPRENDGSVKRQIYVDGFFPEVDVLQGSVDETVVMTRAGNCPSYNPPSNPGNNPGSAGKRINISGNVLQQNTQTPICAMALANGQYEFTCDGSGSFSLNIPLDNNGQYKLQVYAEGFAPTIQTFDEFSTDNDVRMARASECQ